MQVETTRFVAPEARNDRESFSYLIGQKVWKNPKTSSPHQPKPFKSGLKVNTVKDIVTHEQTGGLGFTFLEDESVVQCFRCSAAPEHAVNSQLTKR